ncbi:MAG TPA: sigma-70 family RNA polymerase sigma factor [Polyangiales bacterium]|nr:sigma-70 family RNA polymerase sigma factor [Polyangiales bacterium]
MSEDVASVIREHGPFVWRVLRHLGVPTHQLPDSSQEVFVAVFRSLDRFEGRSTLRTWLYGICRNVAATSARNRARSREQLAEELPELAAREEQTSVIARRELQAGLQDALRKLPEGMRSVFVLFELECMAMADVAAAIGCSESTAYSRLYAARENVRKHLVRVGVLDADRELAEVLP